MQRFKGRKIVWRGLAALLLGGVFVVAGCANQKAEAPQQQQQKEPVAAVAAAPEGSSKEEAREKTGAPPHHADPKKALSAHTHTTTLDFASDPAQIPAGRPATWTLTIRDAQTGTPVKDFAIVHDKRMHLIVVSSDLSWFNHLHPTYKGNGVFTITATLPRAGAYKLFADYTPQNKPQEVAQHEFATEGARPAPASAPLAADPMRGAWMTKRVAARPEGHPEAAGGANYEVALMPMPARLVAGQDAMLHFQVRDASGKPVRDLQPYLGALGHAVLLSSDAKTYLHSHPMEGGASMDGMKGMEHGSGAMEGMAGHDHHAAPKGGGPDVQFHTNFPAPGLYKVWGQFQHRGKIITAPFVLSVTGNSARAAAVPATVTTY